MESSLFVLCLALSYGSGFLKRNLNLKCSRFECISKFRGGFGRLNFLLLYKLGSPFDFYYLLWEEELSAD
jgi:hypothetical protein